VRIQSIYVRIGPLYGGPVMSIRMQDEYLPVLSLVVEGDERTRVEGITARVEDVLKRGSRKPNLYGFRQVVLALGVVVPASTGLIAIHLISGRALGAISIISVLGVSVALGSLLAWLVPPLELVATGVRSRLHRYR